MTAKIVSINTGGTVVTPGVISDYLVEFLEDCLQRARSGEIVGMAGTMVYPAEAGFMQPAGTFNVGYTYSFAAVGALEYTKQNLVRNLEE